MGRPRLTCVNCEVVECEVGKCLKAEPLRAQTELKGVSCPTHSKRVKKTDQAAPVEESNDEGKAEEQNGDQGQVS